MNDIKFIEYIPAPMEKYLGIIIIQANDFILRYKVYTGKNGKYFFNPPVLKVPDVLPPAFVPAFDFADAGLKEEINRFLREKASQYVATPEATF